MFMHFHAYVPSIFFSSILCCWYFSDCLSLSPSLSFLGYFALWHLNASPLHPRTHFNLRHPLLLPLTPLHLTFGSTMRRPVRTSWRTFLDEAFIWNAKSSYRIFPILTYPLSSIVGDRSQCVASQSRALQDFYSNMHGFDTSVPHFFSHVRGTRIIVTPEIVFVVLYVPRVAHPNYPGYDCLRIVSKDELSSLFYETTSSWGDHQNTHWSAFAKGLRFLNMVMTFILHPLSHRAPFFLNTITEPHSRFLLSLLEDISINFPSCFILSLIDIFRDTATRDKLNFLSTIMRILCHFSVSFLKSPYFLVMSSINAATVRWSEAQLRPRWPRTETTTPPASTAPSTSASSSSTGGVTLEAIMA